MQKLISIDTEKCKRCGICTEICPMGVIVTDEEGYPETESWAYKLCINCGYCVDVCAFNALKHRVRKHSYSSSSAAMKRYKILKERLQEKKDNN